MRRQDRGAYAKITGALIVWLLLFSSPARASDIAVLGAPDIETEPLVEALQRASGDAATVTVIRRDALGDACAKRQTIVFSGTSSTSEVLATCPGGRAIQLGEPPGGDHKNIPVVPLARPPARQFEFLIGVKPSLRAIGVLYSNTPATQAALADVRAVGKEYGIRVVLIPVPSGEQPVTALARHFGVIGAVLVMPDPVVINPETIRPILLATARRQIPVVGGPSPSYVKAGIAFGSFPTTDWVAQQVVHVISGGEPRPIGDGDWEIVYNRNVIRFLGLGLGLGPTERVGARGY